MTRIADVSANQILLSNYKELQRSVLESQRQISTGKASPDFKGLSDKVDLLLTSKSAAAKSERFESLAKEVASRLDLQDLHLTTIANAAKDLRASITESLANDSGLVLTEQLDGFVRIAAAAANATFDGRYIFGGTNNEQPPVNIDSLAGLVGAAAVGDVFDNNQIKQSVRIDASEKIEYGFLASDLLTDVFTAVRAIDALGPFAEHLTPAQEAGIQAEIANLISATEAINSQVARNGILQNETEEAIARHSDQRVFLLGVISDIEDADPAEAISKLNLDQTTAEATARVLADLTRISLLNFI